jgi:hypothetical protein
MHRQREAKSSPCPSFLLFTVLVGLASAGCSDGYREPYPTGPADGPAYIALLLPAVQSAREAARSQQSAESPEFHLEQRLFEGGRAVGTGMLVDDESDLRFHLNFDEGDVGCVDDVPFVHLLLSWHAVPAGQPSGEPIRAAGRGSLTLMASSPDPAPTSSWIVDILPFIDQPPLLNVPERIRFEALLEVLFVSDPCTMEVRTP